MASPAVVVFPTTWRSYRCLVLLTIRLRCNASSGTVQGAARHKRRGIRAQRAAPLAPVLPSGSLGSTASLAYLVLHALVAGSNAGCGCEQLPRKALRGWAAGGAAPSSARPGALRRRPGWRSARAVEPPVSGGGGSQALAPLPQHWRHLCGFYESNTHNVADAHRRLAPASLRVGRRRHCRLRRCCMSHPLPPLVLSSQRAGAAQREHDGAGGAVLHWSSTAAKQHRHSGLAAGCWAAAGLSGRLGGRDLASGCRGSAISIQA